MGIALELIEEILQGAIALCLLWHAKTSRQLQLQFFHLILQFKWVDGRAPVGTHLAHETEVGFTQLDHRLLEVIIPQLFGFGEHAVTHPIHLHEKHLRLLVRQGDWHQLPIGHPYPEGTAA